YDIYINTNFFYQEVDGIRDFHVTGVQTCALRICNRKPGTELLCAQYEAPDEIRSLPLEHAIVEKRHDRIAQQQPAKGGVTPQDQIERSSCRKALHRAVYV